MLFKKSRPPAGRQRSQHTDLEKVNVTSSFSYSSRRSEDTLNKGRREDNEPPRNKLQLLQRTFLLLIVILLLFTLYKVSYVSPNVIVKPSSSSQIISSSELDNYKKFTDGLIASSFLNKNKITIGSSAIVSKIKAKYPQVLAAMLSFNLNSDKPTLYISESQGVLILKTNSNVYYSVNLVGRTILSSSNPANLQNSNTTPLVEDQSGINVGINQQVLPSSDVSFILTVTNELQAKGVMVANYILPAASRELDAYLKGQSYFIKFNLANNDPLRQTGTYLATISQLKPQSITPAKYIDVRVDGRAYYL